MKVKRYVTILYGRNFVDATHSRKKTVHDMI
jgi:hypothetical protein